MPIILNGKALADKICAELKDSADKQKAAGITPRLTIVTSGEDAASKVYVRNKIRRAEEIGIVVNVVHHDAMCFDDATEAYDWHPIIYQMPITGDISLHDLDLIVDTPHHDVDGFVSSVNVAALAMGKKPCNYPCTPKGIMRLLAEYAIPLEGKSACVIGRSNIVGRPMARMLEQVGATVTVCHSKTPEKVMYDAVRRADVVVCAVGRPGVLSLDRANIVTSWNIDWSDKVLIDVGINRDDNGKLCGDIDPEIYRHCKAYTPVPGGIGPMTVAMLMENVIEYYCYVDGERD